MTDNIQDKIFGQPSGAREVMRALLLFGPLRDGDMPSKEGRDNLVQAGMVDRLNGWNWLTRNGVDFALTVMVLGEEKDMRDNRRRLLASAEADSGPLHLPIDVMERCVMALLITGGVSGPGARALADQAKLGNRAPVHVQDAVAVVSSVCLTLRANGWLRAPGQ